MSNRLERFRPTTWHVLLAAPFFALGLALRQPIRDNSFLWHVTAGRLQIGQGSVVTVDPFSFTRGGEPWRTQSWLVDLGYAVLDGRFGLAYVPWMVLIASATLLAAILLVAYRAGRSVPVTAVLGLMTLVVSIALLNPRPALWSFLLFALLVLSDGDERLRWASPLILWLWAAMHASFAIGGLYLFLQVVRRRRWSGLAEFGVSGAAVSLTAHGWGAWITLFEFLGNRSALAHISEWATPDLLTVPIFPLFLGIVILIWGATRQAIRGRDLVVIVPFLALAFSGNRSVLPAWIALSPFVARSLATIPLSMQNVTALTSRVNMALILVLMAIPLFVPRRGEIDRERFPVEASSLLTSDRVFHDDTSGGYLIYSQWPNRLVYVDDRAELYGDMLGEFRRVRGGHADWSVVFARYAIDEVILPVGQPLLETLRLAGWAVAEDASDGYVIMRP